MAIVIILRCSCHIRQRRESATFLLATTHKGGSDMWRNGDASKVLRPNRVLIPLKSASKTHSETLVRPSKIFVWEGYISGQDRHPGFSPSCHQTDLCCVTKGAASSTSRAAASGASVMTTCSTFTGLSTYVRMTTRFKFTHPKRHVASMQCHALRDLNHRLYTWVVGEPDNHGVIFISTNQDFGKRNSRSGTSFRCTFTPPKRRFWKDEQQMRCGFSIDFSMARCPNYVLTPLKSSSKIRISSLFLLPRPSFGSIPLLRWCENWILIPPKRRFRKNEQKMRCGFVKHFSMVPGPNWLLTSLKSASQTRISSFVSRS